MRLYLMRHGIAIDRDDPRAPPEAERFLTREGVERTRAAARGLARMGAEPSLVLTSPYVRAAETARIVLAALELPGSKLRTTNALLPGAKPAALLRELDGEKILCVGHAPHLDEVIAAVLGCKRPVTELKKAGVACLEGRPGSARLVWLAEPKMLRKV